MRLVILLTILIPLAIPALADPAGRVMAEIDGRPVDLPMLDSRYSVNIESDMATVKLTQTFANPSDIPLEAEYLFPLNQRAAVYAMEMRVGDEIVQAVIREKARAEAEFKAAAKAGKAAALLTQHRPNMFTQRIANLMPGMPVTVTLSYVQMVPEIDGQYQLVIPMVVGPRYEGAQAQDLAEREPPKGPDNTWNVAKLPAYPLVAGLDLPKTVASDRVALDVHMVSPIPVTGFTSPSHPLTVTDSQTGLTAGFARGKVMDNRDLILTYQLGGPELDVAALSHKDARGGFLSLMITPPELPRTDTITPRELVFVIDTSGSMGGAPMVASKRFMKAALNGLRPSDYFHIIPFSNGAGYMSAAPLRATAQNLAAGQKFVNGLQAGGGTEINNAIRTAFASPQSSGTMRIVVFLSDGYIGDEAEVLRTIRQQVGKTRIYAFGVGDGVNRYLLDAMADEGRGYARYVGLDEDAGEVADQLAANLKTPLLTDIEIDWGDLKVTGVTPSRLPDLFAGNGLRLYARHNAQGPVSVVLRGLVGGHRAELPVRVMLTEDSAEPALPLIWARSRIADLERSVAVDDNRAASDAEITRLGLEFSLQTRNTSFVAVSRQVVNDTGQKAMSAGVPLPMVSGVEAGAYPGGFAGASSPEPQAVFGFLLVAAMAAAALRRRAA